MSDKAMTGGGIRRHDWVRPLLVAALLGATLALAGCFGKPKPPAPPPPVVVMLSVHVSPDGNPDGAGRASPVVVRLYHLRSEDAFRGLNLDALYAHDKELLAADTKFRDEWTLRPGDTKQDRWEVAADVRVIAVVAALRDYRNVPWRVSFPVPPPAQAQAVRPYVIEIDRAGVRLRDDASTTGR